MRTVSPFTNQLLTRKRTSAPISVREPAGLGLEPSAGGGWVDGTVIKSRASNAVKFDSPRTSVEPGADISVKNRPGKKWNQCRSR